MDEDETYIKGNYNNYDEALLNAKQIIDSFLVGQFKKGMSYETLIEKYFAFGSDPIILSKTDDGLVQIEPFSARNYAKEKVNEMCDSII